MPTYGPYQTAADAVRDAPTSRHPGAPGNLTTLNRQRLTDAIDAAGVDTGDYDRRIIAWLCEWEPDVVQVVIGLISRAHAAGARAERWPTERVLAYLADKGQPIARDTWHSYVRRDRAPQPIERGIWLAADVIAWQASRRGQHWRAGQTGATTRTPNAGR